MEFVKYLKDLKGSDFTQKDFFMKLYVFQMAKICYFRKKIISGCK